MKDLLTRTSVHLKMNHRFHYPNLYCWNGISCAINEWWYTLVLFCHNRSILHCVVYKPMFFFLSKLRYEVIQSPKTHVKQFFFTFWDCELLKFAILNVSQNCFQGFSEQYYNFWKTLLDS